MGLKEILADVWKQSLLVFICAYAITLDLVLQFSLGSQSLYLRKIHLGYPFLIAVLVTGCHSYKACNAARNILSGWQHCVLGYVASAGKSSLSRCHFCALPTP